MVCRSLIGLSITPNIAWSKRSNNFSTILQTRLLNQRAYIVSQMRFMGLRSSEYPGRYIKLSVVPIAGFALLPLGIVHFLNSRPVTSSAFQTCCLSMSVWMALQRVAISSGSFRKICLIFSLVAFSGSAMSKNRAIAWTMACRSIKVYNFFKEKIT